MGTLLSNNLFINVLMIFSLSFIFTYILIPKIINVVNLKGILDKPNSRSSHKQLTPTFGGISFFLVLVFTFYFIRDFDTENIVLNIVAALTILLFTGLKDDLVIISNQSKILAQIAAISIFLFHTNFFAINFHGFLGIYEVNNFFGYILVNFIMFAIINSFNLIDGIDGLAAIIGITVLSFFSIVFYSLEYYFNLFICVALSASLLAFLRYNLSSSKKIFMGDTGSLIIGFIVAFMTITFLKLDAKSINQIGLIPKNGPLVVIAILIFPLFDMGRVFLYRIFDKKHPLKPDKNHTHHLLISLGNSHLKSSILITLFSLIFTCIFIYLSSTISSSLILIFALLISFFVFYSVVFVFLNKQKLNN